MARFYYSFTCLLTIFFCLTTKAQTTSWIGMADDRWSNPNNWTNGVPNASTDAVLGDANFTGSNQPIIFSSAVARSISIGGGGKNIQLTLFRSLTISGNLSILSNGFISQSTATITITGNWTNNNVYSAVSSSASVVMNGVSQTIGGTSTTTFRSLTINSASKVTLARAINVTGTGSVLTINGTLDPATFLVTAGAMFVNNEAVLFVKAPTYAGNYSIAGSTTINPGSIIDYGATGNQTVSNSLTYSTLRISGSGVKTLAGNLPALNSSSSNTGNIFVNAGILDISNFSANRGTTAAGGSVNVLNGATLRIGGTNAFPANYNTSNLSLTSTVEYAGTNQTVAPDSYGNLTLTSSGGAVVKTFPATNMTIAGNLTANIGGGTGVSFTASAPMIIDGNVVLGPSTTFNGATFVHSIGGNFINNGTFTGSTSTIIMTGAGTSISGTGLNNFNNISFSASNITAAGSTTLNIAGTLATVSAGIFTHLTGGTTSFTGASSSISGTNITFDNLSVTGTLSTTSSITIAGNLVVNGSLNQTAGTTIMTGTTKTIGGTGTRTFFGLSVKGTVTTSANFSIRALLDVSGIFAASAGTATFTGNSLLTGTANLFNVTLNGLSLQLSANSVLGIGGTYTVSSGTLNVTSTIPNTVQFNGTIAQTINGGTYHHLILSGGSTKTAGGAIILNGNLTIGGSTTFNGGSFAHSILGNWVNQGTYNGGTGTVGLTGDVPATITGTTTFNALTIDKETPSTIVTLQSNVSAATLNMTRGLISTGASTITITTTRTGPGIILGNIQRIHSFNTGTAYAFEGPDNTITFSSATGVTSIGVSVVKGTINDFPFGGAANRVYTISIPAGTYSATLRLHYEDDELNGNVEANMPLWNFNASNWTNVGKSGNNSATNFVELTGLSNVSARWTLSDDANVLQWTGLLSGDWNTPGNWVPIQGSPGAVPTALDIAEIGAAPFSNQPIITTAALAKGILFGSAQAVTLNLNAGGSLNIAGNISGLWSANANHTINVGAQTMTLGNDLVLSDGSAGHSISINIGTGTVNVGGDISQTGGSLIFSGPGSLVIGDDYLFTGGTFAAGTGTVTYNGVSTQTMAGLNYNNLAVNTTGTGSVGSPVSVAGNFNLQAGLVDLLSNLTVAGNFLTAVGTDFDSRANTVSVGGNWTVNGTFTPGAGTVVFNGTGNQTISSTNLHNLLVNKTSGTITLAGNLSLDGDFSIDAGTVDLAGFSASRTVSGGKLELASGTSLLAAAASNYLTGYSTYDLNPASTVNFYGTVAQTVPPVTYGNVIFSNTGTKTISGFTTVLGDLTIGNGTTLDAGGANTIALSGNWINNGTFIPSTGTILANGTGKTINGNTTFNRLSIYGNYTVVGDITYNGLLNVTPGGIYDAGPGLTTLNGDLTNSGSLTVSGVTTFSGNQVQTIRLLNALVSNIQGVVNFNGTVAPVLNSTTSPTFVNLNINNTGGIDPSVDWLVLGNFLVGPGATFNGGTHTHTFQGNVTNNGSITSSGKIIFNPATLVDININFGNAYISTGTTVFSGTGAFNFSGTPNFFQDVIIDNTNPAGISPLGNRTVNGNLIVASNSVFNAGPFTYTVAGDVTFNGKANASTSTMVMTGANSFLSGSAAAVFNNLVITGNTKLNTDVLVAGDFTNNGTVDARVGALIMIGNSPATIGGSTNPSTIAQFSINKDYSVPVTLAQNISDITSLAIEKGILDAGIFTLTQNPVDLGSLIVQDSSVFKIGGTNSLPVFNSYTLDTLSTVEYAGSTQSITVPPVPYGNLAISAAGNKTPGGALTVLHDFTLTNGTFVGGAFTHLLGGDWTMTGGTFNNAGTTIQLNGADSQFIASTGAFNNLTLNKTTGIAALSGDITVNNTLALSGTAARFRLFEGNMTIGNTGTITGANSSHYLVADSTGVLQQRVNAGASKPFPVGTTFQYIPATVALTGGSTADDFRVRVLQHVLKNGTSGRPSTNAAVDASWLISESVAGGSTATITLQWPAVLELPGFTRNACRVAHYVTGVDWEFGTTDIAASGANPYSASRGGFTTFSPFAVSNVDALPLTWLSLSGRNLGNDNEISWSTATEINNWFFAVEVSANGSAWQEVGRVNGGGNSTTEQHYKFLHRNIQYSNAFYRIKQVDYDGHFSYSKTIRIDKNDQGLFGFVFVSSPANNEVIGQIRISSAFKINLIASDANGRILSKQNLQLAEGNNLISINVTGWTPGIYFLQYADDKGKMQTTRFVKK